MLALVFAAAMSTVPSPSPSPLKTIVRERVSPLCTTLKSNVFLTIQGLRINDKLVGNAADALLEMGKDFTKFQKFSGVRGSQQQAMWGNTAAAFSGEYDQNPALQFDAQHLMQLSAEVQHNLEIIDNLLQDPSRFPADVKTAQDRQAAALKTQLQAVADQQRSALNQVYGLADTYELQALIARGDGTSGAINGGGSARVSHDDQPVSFQDVLGASERARQGSHADPIGESPGVTVQASELAHNPFARFYVSVAQNQAQTRTAESALAQSVFSAVNECK